ncbi:hypothetical protein KIF24_10435 [Micromonospora sp. Llam7]|uniref:WXG100-like domain-containing protein n=1 Tax=Micromonospora tarapacensis TaxID=2835305 RepID=UPI001C831DF0|nr:hypothetical protein [Micromonospora tarapacensis]MBX7266402.1 hypothetical protein [Micromonospora tarapacensis]
MAIQPSPEVAEFLKWVSGEEVPGLNEDRLFAVADAYRDAATGLTDDLAPLVVAAVNGIRANFEGEAERAYAASMAKFVTEHPRYLYTAADELIKAGDAARKTGTQVQYVKLIIILTIVELMVELAVTVALAFFFPGLWGWIAARCAIVRFMMQTLLRRLIMLVVSNMVMGVLFQVTMDALAQRIQLSMGTRDDWDGNLTRQSAEVGLLGGAVSLGLGSLGSGLGKGLGKLLRRDGVDAGPNALRHLTATFDGPGGKEVADDVPVVPPRGLANTPSPTGSPLLDKIGEIGQEAGAEYLTEGLYGLMRGEGWDVSGFAATSGVFSGLNGAFGEYLGDVLHRNLPGGAIVNNVPTVPDGSRVSAADSKSPGPQVTPDGPLPPNSRESTTADPGPVKVTDPSPSPSSASALSDPPVSPQSGPDAPSAMDRPPGSEPTSTAAGQAGPGDGLITGDGVAVVPGDGVSQSDSTVVQAPAGVTNPFAPQDLQSPQGLPGSQEPRFPDSSGPTGPDAGADAVNSPGTSTTNPFGDRSTQEGGTPAPGVDRSASTNPYASMNPFSSSNPFGSADPSPLVSSAPQTNPFLGGDGVAGTSPMLWSQHPFPLTTRSDRREGRSDLDGAGHQAPDPIMEPAPTEVDSDATVPTSAAAAVGAPQPAATADTNPQAVASVTPMPPSPSTAFAITDPAAASSVADLSPFPDVAPDTFSAEEVVLTDAEARDIASTAIVSGGGILFPGPDRVTDEQAARYVPTSTEKSRVLVHGDGARVLAGGRKLTAVQFAQVLRALPDSGPGTAVQLISCGGATTGPVFAADLAVALGTPVVAATTYAWTMVGSGGGRTGWAVAAEVSPDGRMRPNLSATGTFVEYEPDGAGGVKVTDVGPYLRDGRPERDDPPASSVEEEAEASPERTADPDPASPQERTVESGWYPWATLTLPTGYPMPTGFTLLSHQPDLLTAPGIVGGPTAPAIALSNTDTIRQRISQSLASRAEFGITQAQASHLVDEQLTDEVLVDGVDDMHNGNGLRLTLGSGTAAIELLLRVQGPMRDVGYADATGGGASADPFSNGSSPDRRQPQRESGADSLGVVSGTKTASGAVSYSMTGPGFGGLPVTIGPSASAGVASSTTRTQQAQRSNRSNEELTVAPAGTGPHDPDNSQRFYQATFDLQVSAVWRGQDTPVALVSVNGTQVTFAAVHTLAQLTATDLSNAQTRADDEVKDRQDRAEAALRPGATAEKINVVRADAARFRLPASSVSAGVAVSPTFFDAVMAQVPDGIKKVGGKFRADLAAALSAKGLAGHDSGITTGGYHTDKMTSRRAGGIRGGSKGRFTVTRGQISLTGTLGTPVLLTTISTTGRGETALRSGYGVSNSKTDETAVRLAATLGVHAATSNTPSPKADYGTLVLAGTASVERTVTSSISSEAVAQIDAKSKTTGDLLLYRIPITVEGMVLTSADGKTPPTSIDMSAVPSAPGAGVPGPGQVFSYRWLTPDDARRLGYPGAFSAGASATTSTATTSGPTASAGPTSVLPKIYQWQPMVLPDIREIRTGYRGNSLWKSAVDAVRAVSPDLLPAQGSFGRQRQRHNEARLRHAIQNIQRGGSWRSLLSGGLRVPLTRPPSVRRGTHTPSRYVNVVIKMEMTSALDVDREVADGAESRTTQIEDATQATIGVTKGRGIGTVVKYGAYFQGGARTDSSPTMVRRFRIRTGYRRVHRRQRFMTGGSAVTTGSIVKSSRPTRPYRANITFTIFTEYANRPRAALAKSPGVARALVTTVATPIVLAVEGGLRLSLPTLDSIVRALPNFTPPSVHLVTEPALVSPVPSPFTISGPHHILDVSIQGDALFTAADVALSGGPEGFNGTGGKLWTSWRSGSVTDLAGNPLPYHSSALTEPGSPAEAALRQAIDMDAFRAFLDVHISGRAPISLLSEAAFTDLKGDLTVKVEFFGPIKMAKLVKDAPIHGSQEVVHRTESGERNDSGHELASSALVISNSNVPPSGDPKGAHRNAAGARAGYSQSKGKRADVETSSSVARREVFDGVSEILLAGMVITLTGSVQASGSLDVAKPQEVTVRLVADQSVLLQVSQAEANRILGLAVPAGAGGLAARAPAFMTTLVGNGFFNDAVDPTIAGVGAASLRDRIEQSLPGGTGYTGIQPAMPERLRREAADMAADLLGKENLRRSGHGLYDGGLIATRTVDSGEVGVKVVVKVAVRAKSTSTGPGNPLPVGISASLFQAHSTSERALVVSRKGVSAGAIAAYHGQNRLQHGPGNQPGLQMMPAQTNLGMSGFRERGKQVNKVSSLSGYVEKSGELAPFSVDHEYVVEVTVDRIPTKLGTAMGRGLLLMNQGWGRQKWTSDGVDQAGAVQMAVPKSATDRSPGLSVVLANTGAVTDLAALAYPSPVPSGPQPVQPGVSSAWMFRQGTRYWLEGALGAPLRAAISAAYGKTDTTSGTSLINSRHVEDFLDDFLNPETSLATVAGTLSQPVKTGPVFDDKGAYVTKSGVVVRALFEGQPLLVDGTDKVELEFQTEESNGVRETGAKGSEGSIALSTAPRIGSQPEYLTPNSSDPADRTAHDWVPHEPAVDGAASSGSRNQSGSGSASSVGNKIKMKGNSGLYAVNLIFYVNQDVDIAGAEQARPVTNRVEFGALVRLWEADIKAHGMFGWQERLGFPKSLTEVAKPDGTRLDVHDGQLRLRAAGDPSAHGDISDLPSANDPPLLVGPGVTIDQLTAFLDSLRPGSAPTRIRMQGVQGMNQTDLTGPSIYQKLATDHGATVVVPTAPMSDPLAGPAVVVGSDPDDPHGKPGWQPIVAAMTFTPAGPGPVQPPTQDEIRPTDQWLTAGHGTVETSPGTYQLPGHAGVAVEATPAGLWLRPDPPPVDNPTAEVRSVPPRATGPLLIVGTDPASRAALPDLLGKLHPALRGLAMVAEVKATGTALEKVTDPVPAIMWLTDRKQADLREATNNLVTAIPKPGKPLTDLPSDVALTEALDQVGTWLTADSSDWLREDAVGRTVTVTTVGAAYKAVTVARTAIDTYQTAAQAAYTAAANQAAGQGIAVTPADPGPNSAALVELEAVQAHADALADLRDRITKAQQALIDVEVWRTAVTGPGTAIPAGLVIASVRPNETVHDAVVRWQLEHTAA